MKVYNSTGAILFDLVLAFLLGFVVYEFIAIVSPSAGFTVGGIVAVIAFLILFSLAIRVINEWNRMPVLRLGTYKGIIGPGFQMIIPFIEVTPSTIDLRVINTTFSAEQTLTKDNVPVNVDAILFWQVSDPEAATLKVQSYINTVQLASQTALRDVIGKSTLSEMLAGRDTIGKSIDDLIQERVSTWGIKTISVEIRDVKIPQELQDAMAKVATADREKMARVKLAESESLAADKMLEASKKYEEDPTALQLRALNMMYEISVSGKNQIIFIPTESKGLAMPTPIGVLGVEEIVKKKAAQTAAQDDNTTQGKGRQGKRTAQSDLSDDR